MIIFFTKTGLIRVCLYNLKPDFQRYSRNLFSPGSRVANILALLREKMNFDCVINNQEKLNFGCVIKNLVSNPFRIYWKMNRGLHDIPWLRI